MILFPAIDLFEKKAVRLYQGSYENMTVYSSDPLSVARDFAAKGASAAAEEVKCPPAEVCTASIPGIEVMDLEDAAKALWKAGIYAETGMGCTGPLVMMSDKNHDKAVEILKAAGYIG